MVNNKRSSFGRVLVKSACVIISGILMSVSGNQAVQAADLIESYERALRNDPILAGQTSLYQASKYAVKYGRSVLLPKISLTFTRADNTYRSDSQQVRQGEPGNPMECFSERNPGGIGGLFGCMFTKSAGLEVTDSVDETFTATRVDLTMKQPIFAMDLWYGYKGTKAKTEKGAVDYEVARMDAMVRVAEAYFGVLAASDGLHFAILEEKDVRDQLRLVRKMYSQGLQTETDLYDAQSGLELKKGRRDDANVRLQRAYRQLMMVTGVRDDTVYPLSDELPIEKPQPSDPDAWVKKALARNPQLEGARMDTEFALSEYQRAKAQHLPKVGFFVTYLKNEMAGGEGELPGSDQTSIGLAINIPLYSGGGISAQSKGLALRYQASRDQLTYGRWKLEAGTLQLLAEVEKNVRTYEAVQRVISSTNNAYRSTKKSYQEGSRPIVDLFRKQKAMYDARLKLVRSRYEYVINTLKLKQAVGILTREDLVSLNKWLEKGDQIE